MSFTTVESVRLFMSRDTFTVEEIAQIEALITQIDDVIENYCGWKMLARDYVNERYDGTGISELDLKVYPINSLTKVVVDGTDVTSQIELIENDGLLIYTDRTTVFTAGRYNVKVDCNAGYNEVNTPPAITYAANYLIAINFNRSDSDNRIS